MLLSTDNLAAVPDLLAATLHESVEQESTLSLEFAGYGPAWALSMEPLTLMHRGAPIFHGMITSVARSLDAGVQRSVIEATNAIWVLEQKTAATQIDELKESLKTDSSSTLATSFEYAVIKVTGSWAAMASACRYPAPGWACNAAGQPMADAELSLNVSRALYSVTPKAEKKKFYKAWELLTMMRESNPDCFFLVRPSGVIEAVSVSLAEPFELPLSACRAVSDIARMRENEVAGVVVAVGYSGASKLIGVPSTYVRSFPEDVDLNATGLRFFSASVDKYSRIAPMLNALKSQAEAFYHAANVPLWAGSIEAYADRLAASPLGRAICISGGDVPEEWRTMRALCTAVEWDLKAGTASLSLGFQIADPQLYTLEFNDTSGGGGGGGGDESGGDNPDGGGDDDDDDKKEEEDDDRPTPGPSIPYDLDALRIEFDHLWVVLSTLATYGDLHPRNGDGEYVGDIKRRALAVLLLHAYGGMVNGSCPNHLCGHTEYFPDVYLPGKGCDDPTHPANVYNKDNHITQ